MSRQSPSTQDEMYDCAPSAAVAVHEWVDGLELRVRDRGLGDRGKFVGIAEGTEIVEEL